MNDLTLTYWACFSLSGLHIFLQQPGLLPVQQMDKYLLQHICVRPQAS